MTSKYAGKLRDANFGRQFLGLTLKDFELYDVISGKATGKVAGIKNPAPGGRGRFQGRPQATKKNLILIRTSSSIRHHRPLTLPSPQRGEGG